MICYTKRIKEVGKGKKVDVTVADVCVCCQSGWAWLSKVACRPQAHPRVAARLALLIKGWAAMKEFRDDPALKYVYFFLLARLNFMN